MELGDCDGYDDSDVVLEGGISAIGPVNTLMPRFAEEDHRESQRDGQNERSSSNKRDTSGKRKQFTNRNHRLSPSNLNAGAPISTQLKVPGTVVPIKQKATLEEGACVRSSMTNSGRTPKLVTIKVKKMGSVSPNGGPNALRHSTTNHEANLQAIVKARSNPRMGSGTRIEMNQLAHTSL